MKWSVESRPLGSATALSGNTMGATFEVAQTIRGCSIYQNVPFWVLRSAGVNASKGLFQAPLSLLTESRVSFSLPLHLFTLCKVDSRRDSVSASSQDFHFPSMGLLR
jgi:hypothetical protein